MKVQDILQKKSSEVFTIRTHQTLHEASQILTSKNVGVLIVVDAKNSPIGIISERDLVHQMASKLDQLGTIQVGDAMTKDLIVALPDDDIAYLGNVMTSKRIRHLPVMHNGKLVGIVSIGDVVKAQMDYFEGEAHTLQHYITGGYA